MSKALQVQICQAETLEYFKAEFASLGKRHCDEWKALEKRFRESGTWKGKYASWQDAEADMSAIFENSYYQRPAVKIGIDMAKGESETVKSYHEEKSPVGDVRVSCPDKPPVASETKQPPASGSAMTGLRDATGFPIPKSLQDAFKRRQEVTGMEYYASRVAAFLESCQTSKDSLYTHLYHTGFTQHLANHAKTVRHAIAECTPDVVCPHCNGAAPDEEPTMVIECSECHGCGWISQERWDRNWVKSNDKDRQSVVAQRSK